MPVITTSATRPSSTSALNFARNPMLVYWEMTQACGLACRHCRASAVLQRHPRELTTEESQALLEQIAAFGDPLPHLILTGGDPLVRPDLFELVDYARALGLRVSITPSATSNLTVDTIRQFKAHGMTSMALSLDGSTVARHAAIRGLPGCFDRTLRAMHDAVSCGLPLQINTLVAEQTVDDLTAIYELLASWPLMRWSLFFLIRVGRGQILQEIPPERSEQLMNWVWDLARVAPFQIKTTEAQFYRRVALTRMRREGTASEEIRRSSVYHGFGVRDGHGIVFISHTGEIYPAGFLPMVAGDVRRESLVEIYRRAPLFEQLHDPHALKGKCGRCEFRVICGGSRARAYAATGDPLASDPLCLYEPLASSA